MKSVKILVLLMALLVASDAWAYSYAAAGKEPLIDGREAILKNVAAADWVATAKAVQALKPDLAYLAEHHDKTLIPGLDSAVAAKDAKATQQALVRVFAAEIERRLDGAGKNLADYQTARVLLVKSKRFADNMAADLDAQTRAALDAGLTKALNAIGNPGLFGAGKRDADPAAFAAARTETLRALGR